MLSWRDSLGWSSWPFSPRPLFFLAVVLLPCPYLICPASPFLQTSSSPGQPCALLLPQQTGRCFSQLFPPCHLGAAAITTTCTQSKPAVTAHSMSLQSQSSLLLTRAVQGSPRCAGDARGTLLLLLEDRTQPLTRAAGAHRGLQLACFTC